MVGGLGSVTELTANARVLLREGVVVTAEPPTPQSNSEVASQVKRFASLSCKRTLFFEAGGEGLFSQEGGGGKANPSFIQPLLDVRCILGRQSFTFPVLVQLKLNEGAQGFACTNLAGCVV